MKVLMLTKYGPKAASCRYRFLQYLPYLEREGIHCTIAPLFDDCYLEHKFRTGSADVLHVGRALIRRTRDLLSAANYDAVLLHYEAFPYLPSTFEAFLRWRGIPYLCDYDDAIFHNYDHHTNLLVRLLLGKKIPRVMSGASQVLAGSEYLEDFARRHNRSVHRLPTVVDTDLYTTADCAERNGFTVGWIGSPSTAEYLAEVADPLRLFCKSSGARVALVGSGPIDLPDVPLDIKSWSEDSEIEDIRRFDVGIMPLPDSPWARGKCAFKLIQYMACGLPVVASPVGMNKEVVEHGVNGFLAQTSGEWIDALTSLHLDAELRSRFGAAGRLKVVQRYSLQVTAPRLAACLANAGGRTRRAA
jgi:glycosyltransferase involved in cell wall biosynthesis